jgi:hypothetical protein
MDEAKLMAAVIAIVAAVRTKFPQVDGPFVPLLAMALGAVAWWAHGLDIEGNVFAHGALSALAAVGVLTTGGYIAGKIPRA